MIRAHVFYCVLALTMASLLVRQLHLKGTDVINLLNQIYEVALIWPRGPGRPARRQRDSFHSEMLPEQEEIFNALELRSFAPAVV